MKQSMYLFLWLLTLSGLALIALAANVSTTIPFYPSELNGIHNSIVTYSGYLLFFTSYAMAFVVISFFFSLLNMDYEEESPFGHADSDHS